MEVRGETIGAKIAGRDDMSTASYVSQLIIAVFGIRSYRVTYDGEALRNPGDHLRLEGDRDLSGTAQI